MNLRRDVFQAIADPTRRAILLLVAAQSMSAGAIAANFDTARPTVSKHLQILTECELLEQEQNGREIYYHLNAEKMEEIDEFVEQFRKIWEIRFNQLDDLLSKMKEEKNGQ
jgi:DNA-binding transcriptional ArsR family regulator